MRRRITAIVLAAALAALAVPAAAGAVDYASVDTPGPPLSPSPQALGSSLLCTAGVDNATTTPVLLVPATGVDPHANYSWNWEPALDKLGIPWCAVTLPNHSMDDIQVAGEYVVNAIRTMFERSGRKISVMGHSQGGMVPRWAYRFWPDTRAMVDDEIGLAGSNHGSDANPDPTCLSLLGGCSVAFQQQHKDSEFLKALNSYQETFPGISYTEIYSHTDEVVTPNADEGGSSSLHGGGGEITNVATQDVCPLDIDEHLSIGTIDPVAYALAVDALTHPGPADPSRIDPGVCAQLLQPGINPLTFATDLASATLVLANSIAFYPKVESEPPLACYVTASCLNDNTFSAAQSAPVAAQGVGGKKAKHKRKKHRKHHRRGHRR